MWDHRGAALSSPTRISAPDSGMERIWAARFKHRAVVCPPLLTTLYSKKNNRESSPAPVVVLLVMWWEFTSASHFTRSFTLQVSAQHLSTVSNSGATMYCTPEPAGQKALEDILSAAWALHPSTKRQLVEFPFCFIHMFDAVHQHAFVSYVGVEIVL